MKYSIRYIANKTMMFTSRVLSYLSVLLGAWAPAVKKEINLVRAYYGYTVKIDGVTLDFDLSYSDAMDIFKTLERKRNKFISSTEEMSSQQICKICSKPTFDCKCGEVYQ